MKFKNMDYPYWHHFYLNKMSEFYGDDGYFHNNKNKEDHKYEDEYFAKKDDDKHEDPTPENHCPTSCYCHGDRESHNHETDGSSWIQQYFESWNK